VKHLGIFLATFAVLVGLTAWWTYTTYADEARQQALARLTVANSSRADALAKWRSERYADAQYYVDNAAVLGLVARLDDTSARAELSDLMGRMQQNHGYQRIGIHNADGVERLASPATPEPAPGHMAGATRAAVATGGVQFLDLHDSGQDPHVALLAPLWSRPGGPGAVVLTIDARTSVSPFLTGGAPLTTNTRSLVVLRDGETIRVVNQVAPGAGGHQPVDVRLPISDTHLAVVQAGLGHRGLFESVDAHGTPVVAVASALPDTGWALLTMAPAAELFAGIRNRLWVTLIIAALTLVAGLAIAGFVTQAQQRRLTEVEQRHLAELRAMAHIVDVSPVVFLRVKAQPDLPIDWVSNNISRWGYEAKRLMAGDPPTLSLLHPEDRGRVQEEALRHVANGSTEFSQEYRVVTPTGRVILVDDRSTIQRDADGRPLAIEGVITDVTERRHLEAQFAQAQKMEIVGRLAGGVAHDFNNLLTVINGYADFALMELPDDDALRPMILEIKRAGERATALTGQLLTFSRRQVVQPMHLDLNEVVTGMVKMLQRLIGEDLHLETQLADDAGGPVFLDRSQLEQVLMNLAVNARDAMPKGGTLTIRTERQGDGQVCLSVIDTGVGMTAEVQARLFEPFFTTKGSGKGTGLGLATVYGIVTQAGGRVTVESRVNHGSTFRVSLPVVADDDARIESATDEPAVRGSEQVLLVEDEPALRRVAERILATAGYRVTVAADGAEAIGLVLSGACTPEVLVTDVVMPGINGKDLAEALRRRLPTLPVVLTSGYLHDVIPDVGELGPGYRFVPKPYTQATLTRAIRDVLASV
jgi:PAS domain S-box-containing protein